MKSIFAAFALISFCSAVILEASTLGGQAPLDVPSAKEIAQHICVDHGNRDEFPVDTEAVEVVAKEEGISVDEVCRRLMLELAAEEGDEFALAQVEWGFINKIKREIERAARAAAEAARRIAEEARRAAEEVRRKAEEARRAAEAIVN